MALNIDPNTDEIVLDFDHAPKRAPRVWRPVLPTLVVLVLAGIVFGLIWGGMQTANLYAATVAGNTPAELASAQSTYYMKHKAYTKDLSQLVDTNGKQYTPAYGTTVQMAAVCSTGWVAKVSVEGRKPYYLSSVGGQATGLDSLQLPDCMTAADIGKDPRNSQVTISNLTVARSTKVGERVAGQREGAHIVWQATNQCEANVKPSYQVTLTMQKPAGATGSAYLFKPTVLTTDKTSLQAEDIKNGMTYTVDVQGSCGENFTNASVTTDFTQTLPAPQVMINRGGNGRWDVLVAASSSPFINYDIQYKHAYSDGWTNFITNFVRGTVASPSGYYYNSGDLFRAKATRLDGQIGSNYGTGNGVRSTDAFSSYNYYNYYNGYNNYRY